MTSERETIYNQLITESSNTPLIELTGLDLKNGNRIFLKLEYLNPVGSVHMRVYPFVFKNAETLGFIKPFETPVIEASFGNAGAAFTYCANHLGYNKPFKPTVVVPSNISQYRLKQLQELDAQLLFSASEKFNLGYVELLESELEKDRLSKASFSRIDTKRLYPVTKTRKNAKLPYRNLIDEVFKTMKENGSHFIDFFVGIIGSGTSISGIGERLKEINPNGGVIVAEADEFRNSSSLLQRNCPLPISSAPEGFPYVAAIGVPLERLNLNRNIITGIVQYPVDALDQLGITIKNEHGLNLGITTLGSIHGAITFSKNTVDKKFLVCAYDEQHKWV